MLLHGDVLGHRLIDIVRARLVRARDLRLSPARAGGYSTEWTHAGTGGLNVVATVIIAALLMLSGTLMSTTMFPHLNVPELVMWLSAGIMACLAAFAIALRVRPSGGGRRRTVTRS